MQFYSTSPPNAYQVQVQLAMTLPQSETRGSVRFRLARLTRQFCLAIAGR